MPLQIKISSTQEMTPEAITPFKETLLSYLRARNTQIRKIVDNNLNISLGERIPVYVFTLQALLETRSSKLDDVVKPLSSVPEEDRPPETAAPTEPTGPSDVWQYKSEFRPDFASHDGTYFVPDSRRVQDCTECYQRGIMGCRQCFGKGQETCPTCLGSGSQACLYCRGLMKINCLRCAGEGRLTAAGVHGAAHATRCDACNGSGKFPCNHCAEGRVPCTTCNATGKGPCRRCEGTGKVNCTACGGDKKVISGRAFRAEFRPVQVTASGFAQPGPREAQDLAMGTLKPLGEIAVSTEESFDKQIQTLAGSGGARGTLQILSDRLKIKLTPMTRAAKYRLEVSEGAVVRLSGYCAGQEFAYWMIEGNPTIVAEKDPLASLGDTMAVSAEEAKDAGDWQRAVDLAYETLELSPDHMGAQGILSDWRKKIVSEVFGGAFLSGLLVAGGYATYILTAPKGLHRMGAIGTVSLWQFGVAFAAAMCAIVPFLRLYRSKVRWPALIGVLLSAHLMFGMVAGHGFDWNPVRRADQTALMRELSQRFKFGGAKVYYEPDLLMLRSIEEKYKNSLADLSVVTRAIDKQLELKAAFERDQSTFNEKIAAILKSNQLPPQKREQVEDLRAYYKLMNIDLSAADRALAEIDMEARRINMLNNQVRNRIVITPVRSIKKAGTKPVKAISKTPVKKTPAKTKPAAKKAAPTKKKPATSWPW